MDPRHKLYKTLDTLAIDSENTKAMSARTDAEATNVQATSGVSMEGIKKKLEDGLGATHVEIEDLSGMHKFLFYSEKKAEREKVKRDGQGLASGYFSSQSLSESQDYADITNRRMRANVRGYHRITTICQEDHSSTTPASQQYAEGGNCSDTCVDTKVSYAGGMGKEKTTVNTMQPSHSECTQRMVHRHEQSAFHDT